jgi:hypothetical protein
MSTMIENLIVLLLVAAAAIYTVVRLCRLGTGKSKCACGTDSCGAASASCGDCPAAASSGNDASGLPIIPPCGQGGCGKM